MENERERLARLYAEKSDEALVAMAGNAGSLTEAAREALRAELSARGLKVELAGEPEESEAAPAVSGPLVMVKRFRDLPEAVVAKSILDSAQIDSFLADEYMVRMDWLYSNLLGGAKLMVRPEDLDVAMKLLEETPLENTEEGTEEIPGDSEEKGSA